MATKIRRAEADPEAMTPLTPAVFYLMLALSEGESHGYNLMTQVNGITEGQMQLGPGTLYRSIQRMLVDELIEEVAGADNDPVDERRRYYRLTEFGKQVAQAEARRLARLVEVASERGLLSRKALKAVGRKL